MGQQATQLVPHQQEEARSAVERIAAFAARGSGAAAEAQVRPTAVYPRTLAGI